MRRNIKRITALCFSMILIASTVTGNTSLYVQAAAAGESSTEENTTDSNIIEIKTTKDFETFVKNCQYDSWSVGKTVSLTADINLSKVNFSGISYFSGTFEGNGYEISHITLDAKGSEYGFFRYLSASAVVNDLKLSGAITSEGSCERIGGLAGVNYGTINQCSFEGNVDGKTEVGAIAGVNKSTGKILDCSSQADVTATNKTGGIVGNNEGLVTGCLSESSVNTDELQTTMDLGGVDIGTLNVTQHVIDRNDMGGIAGLSSGVINDCTNKGTVGYAHTGYNVGGIAGRQSGKIIDCTNEGTIYGRKDVGGIVGQAEPYIESEYLEDKVNQVQDSVNSISSTLDNMASTVSNTSEEAKSYMDSLTEQYNNSTDTVTNSLGSLTDTIGESNSDAQPYLDSINESLDKIDSIQGDDGISSEEQADQISDEWQNISNNLSEVQESMSDSDATTEDFVNDISNQIKDNEINGDIDKLTDTVNSGIQSVTNGIKSISNQINNIQSTVEDTASIVTGSESRIEDISTAAGARETDGVISGSINRSEISGDLNVGGIAGTMNIEYDLDPEFDADFTDSLNVAVRSTVNNVIISCINYGQVTSKKDCVGGIAGLQELGLITASEGYGAVKSETGDYAGGIAGNSASAISESYSLCNISVNDYAGGIAGTGYTIKNCVSASAIDSDGEGRGSIAGKVSDEGEVKGNQFVNDELDGIDNINYAGIADETSYDELMKQEGIPEGFNKVTITFKADDKVIAKKTVAYNGSFTDSELPEIPEKDGYYAKWEDAITTEAITENKTVEAEYTRWTESIAGKEKSESGNVLFLLEGEFYNDTRINMAQCEADIKDGQVSYSYDWNMENVHDRQYDTLTAHFYLQDESGKNEVWYREAGSDSWIQADTKADGSYLVADIPYEASFALVHIAENHTIYYIGGAVVIVAMLAIIIVKKSKKR